MLKLYDLERSGNCYKVRLFLSMLGVEYEKISIAVDDLQSQEFIDLNPNGLVPVLIDGDDVIIDSAAILAYLALTRGGETWFPQQPLQLARVLRWLTFEQAEGRYGLARARAIALGLASNLAHSGTLADSRTIATAALGTLEQSLASSAWLAGNEQPTIADIACYPYTALITDAGISLEPWTAVSQWIRRFEALPGYVDLPRVGG